MVGSSYDDMAMLLGNAVVDEVMRGQCCRSVTCDLINVLELSTFVLSISWWPCYFVPYLLFQ